VPWTSRKSGPAVVVKRADRQFSGRRALRMDERVGCAGLAGGALSLDSAGGVEGISIL
jgi:hypothetical protein